MRYKVGDAVRIKKDLQEGNLGLGERSVYINDDMVDFIGKTATIIKVLDDLDYNYKLDIDDGVTYWSDDMLVDNVEERKFKTWEVIKMLSENENSRFKLIDGTKNLGYIGIVAENVRGFLIASSEDKVDCIPLSNISGVMLNGEWKLLKESVSFIEAVNSGKKIMTEHFAHGEYVGLHSVLTIMSGKIDKYCVDLINGKWYIED